MSYHTIPAFLRNKLAIQEVKACARPMQQVPKGVVVDQFETLPMDLSQAAEEFQKNPPVEVPVDSEPPKRFADMVHPGSTMTWQDLTTGDGNEKTPLPNPPLAAVSGGEKTVEQEVVEVEGEEHTKKETPVEIVEDVPVQDLFLAQAEMTRKDQMAEKKHMETQRKRKLNEIEDGEELTSKEKAAAKKQKAAAKAAAKKQKTKEKAAAKAAAKKEKKKEKAEEKKKIAMAKKDKKKAAAAEKKEKAAAKAQAKSKGRKRKGVDAEQTPAPVSPVDPVPPSQPRPEIPEMEMTETKTEKKTFARRNRPASVKPAARFDACKGVFISSIKDKVKNPSVLEARFPFKDKTLDHIFCFYGLFESTLPLL